MDETQIAEKLKQNIPTAEEFTPAPADAVAPSGVADIAVPYQLDELTQYKLCQYFGEKYRESDEVSRQQSRYIYEKVSKMVNTTDYGFVVERIRELERIIGISNSQNRMYRLYEWLKLDSMRGSIESQMRSIGDNYARW